MLKNWIPKHDKVLWLRYLVGYTVKHEPHSFPHLQYWLIFIPYLLIVTSIFMQKISTSIATTAVRTASKENWSLKNPLRHQVVFEIVSLKFN